MAVVIGPTLAFAAQPAVSSASGAPRFEVVIHRPRPGVPLFGPVDVRIEVTPPQAQVKEVVLELDGREVARLTAPPYELTVDVGQVNRDHRFVATAYGTTGEVATDVVQSPAIRIDEEVEAALQQLYVTVTSDGRRVLDLGQEDFEVIDDGKRQQIVTFSRGDVALASVVLIDASSSMEGSKLRFALKAATDFAGGVRKQDETSIQLFSDRLLFSSPFTSDPKRATAGLSAVRAEGGTALNDHLYRALGLLEARQGRRVVVFLSDGIDSHSVLGMNEVVWLARRSRSMVYWIRLDNEIDGSSFYSSWKDAQTYRAEASLLQGMVEESGGRILDLERIEQAAEAAQAILSELREQYAIGYYATNRRSDGSWRRVGVRVRRPGLEVRTRDGYLDN